MPLHLPLFAPSDARSVVLQDAAMPEPVTIVVAMVPVVPTALHHQCSKQDQAPRLCPWRWSHRRLQRRPLSPHLWAGFSLDLQRHSWEKKMTLMPQWFHRQLRRTTTAYARPLHHCLLNS